MSETNNQNKNITVEGIEGDNVKPVLKEKPTTFDFKNYLNDKLEGKETLKELKIRLLTVDKDSNSPFKTIHMHSVRVPKEISENGWKNYVCLEKTEGKYSEELGHKCPFCEYSREMFKKSDEATDDVDKERYRKTAIENLAKEVCVMRVVERGHEDDGPKFWKFNIRKDKTDPKSKIVALYNTRKQESIDQEMEENNGVLPEGFIPENILDLENGKDLKVTITAVLDEKGNKTKKKTIDVMDYGKNKPLSTDSELVNKLINDEKIWSDVFVAKPYEYLKIVMDGEIPWFDNKVKKWVPKKEIDNAKNVEMEINAKVQEHELNEVEKRVQESSKVTSSNESDELPF